MCIRDRGALVRSGGASACYPVAAWSPVTEDPMPDKPYEDVQIEGHLIDSLMMPHIMDQIMDLDGEFEILTFEVGRMKDDPSHAVMRIFGRDAAHLDELLQAITEFGVVAVKPQDAVLETADMDGVFTQRFYSTTNLETFVRVCLLYTSDAADDLTRVDLGG